MVITKNKQKKLFGAEWENEAIFQINRQEARSHYFSFETEQLALAGDPNRSKFIQSLSGTWKFHFSSNPGNTIENFEKNKITKVINPIFSSICSETWGFCGVSVTIS